MLLCFEFFKKAPVAGPIVEGGEAMDFELPESIRLMRDSARRFVKNELEPISQQVEEEEKIPESVVQKMRDMGFFGMSAPVSGRTMASAPRGF
jgi:alkylation response protein AidB-like acyl-CoA dehydrogenase